VIGCAHPIQGADDLGHGDGGGGGRDQSAGGGDLASGPCTDVQNDPQNCGTCGHVCAGANVALNGCKAGACVVGTCAPGYYDIDGKPDDGCECKQSSSLNSATMQCLGAASAGTLTDEPASMLVLSGNLVPKGAEQWWEIVSQDIPDADGACDKYDLKISFMSNPSNQYLFDLVYSDCSTPASCQNSEAPTGLTSYEWNSSGDAAGGSECPCNNMVTAAGVHKCTDNSQTLRVRVYRASSAPLTCDDYQILVTNGM
jgi:hypothetical protein